MSKKYKLPAEKIERLVPSIGGAIATDMIMVHGKKVDFMFREHTEREDDSGWFFYGGGETQDYIDDPNNMAIYDVNTIANYDPEIIPFLTYPPGTEIERNAEGKLEVITKNLEKPSITFLPPVVGGEISVTKNWSFEVASRMLRRIDDGRLVIWKPEFTIWLSVNSSEKISIDTKLNNTVRNMSEMAYAFQQENTGDLQKARYQLIENIGGVEQASAYIFGFTEEHEIQLSIYYDSNDFLEEIDTIWKTLAVHNPALH